MGVREITALAKVRRMSASGEAELIRRKAGLSLAEAASAIGVSPGSILRWERGQRRPHGPNAIRYLGLLDALKASERIGESAS